MWLLRNCVEAWKAALEPTDHLFVTVDGDQGAVDRVAHEVRRLTRFVYRVGQPEYVTYGPTVIPDHLGVAANKNTGLELMMETEAPRLWLSDDDSWPLSPASLVAHYNLGIAHSMVCWGRHRRAFPVAADEGPGYAVWEWPRGSVLYVDRGVVLAVGGMVEEFGVGGHEHVEWSNRIHNARLTPAAHVTPLSYMGDRSMGARALWHCEDMARVNETTSSLISRRRHLTTVVRTPEETAKQDALMESMKDSAAYVPYDAEANGRSSATMSSTV